MMKKKIDVVNEVVNLVKRDLVMGRLALGEHISEDSLIYRLDIKRNAAREALAELDRQGVIEIAPFRGAYVRRLSADDVRQIFDTLCVLYRAWGGMIDGPLAKPAVDELERRRLLHSESVERGDPEAIYLANASFHAGVLSTLDNRFLAETIDRMESYLHNVRYHLVFSRKEYTDEGCLQHAAMVRYLHDGDGEAFAEVCIMHISHAKNYYSNSNVFLK
ncbi:GntR family transcriptional regulator [Shinella sp. S4-D37]|uniref:GntR family transcriptional regulator n=1 Tax=Shinella sp. S4-D37 TaxID=3161999 RepID=UPI0034677A9A